MTPSQYRFPSEAQLLSADGWLDRSRLPDTAPGRALLYPGLMTQAVQRELGLQPGITRDRDGSGNRFRRIAFFAGSQLFLLAVSSIPTQLLAKYSWLRELGDTPLGEAIEQHAGVQRNDFELLPIAEGSALAENFGGCASWARRYHFELPGGQIAVMEVFDPTLLLRLNQALNN